MMSVDKETKCDPSYLFQLLFQEWPKIYFAAFAKLGNKILRSVSHKLLQRMRLKFKKNLVHFKADQVLYCSNTGLPLRSDSLLPFRSLYVLII